MPICWICQFTSHSSIRYVINVSNVFNFSVSTVGTKRAKIIHLHLADFYILTELKLNFKQSRTLPFSKIASFFLISKFPKLATRLFLSMIEHSKTVSQRTWQIWAFKDFFE